MAVCDNRRIQQHQVFKGIAARGKGSTGWSFGFKLHLVVSDRNDQLKNISQIEHSHHQSPINFLVNLVSGLIAYTHRVKKLLSIWLHSLLWKTLFIHNSCYLALTEVIAL